MLRIIKFLFTGDWHLHEWKIIDKVDCEAEDLGARWTRHYTQCIHCGKIRLFQPKFWLR